MHAIDGNKKHSRPHEHKRVLARRGDNRTCTDYVISLASEETKVRTFQRPAYHARICFFRKQQRPVSIVLRDTDMGKYILTRRKLCGGEGSVGNE